MEQIANLKTLLAAAETDADKFYNKGNKAAGTRLSSTMQQIKVAAQAVRNEVVAAKKAPK